MANIESVFRSLDDEVLETQLLESELFLQGLDLGVAATVISLSAAGCIPFSSCNAGAFGGEHREQYPLVAFYARPQIVELILISAEQAHIGIEGSQHLLAYSDDIRKFSRFAQLLIERKSQFERLSEKAAKHVTSKAQRRIPSE